MVDCWVFKVLIRNNWYCLRVGVWSIVWLEVLDLMVESFFSLFFLDEELANVFWRVAILILMVKEMLLEELPKKQLTSSSVRSSWGGVKRLWGGCRRSKGGYGSLRGREKKKSSIFVEVDGEASRDVL